MSWIAMVLIMVSLSICKYIWHFWVYSKTSKLIWEIRIWILLNHSLNLTKKKKQFLIHFLGMSRLLHFHVFLWLMSYTIAHGKSQKEDKILSKLYDCLGEATQHIVVPEKFDVILSAQKFLNLSKSKAEFTNTSYSRSQVMFVEPSQPAIHAKRGKWADSCTVTVSILFCHFIVCLTSVQCTFLILLFLFHFIFYTIYISL